MIGTSKMTKREKDLQRQVKALEKKLALVNNTILLAESWSEQQLMPDTSICMGALKDIRRIVRCERR